MFFVKKSLLSALGFCAFFLCSLSLQSNEASSQRKQNPANDKSLNDLIESNNKLTHIIVSYKDKIEKLQQSIITYRWATLTLGLTTAGFIVKEVTTRYPEFFPTLGTWLARSIHKASAYYKA